MARTHRRFIPRLESFDERSLPSVTIIESGGDLQLIGDDAGNSITIQDDGTANPGNVIVVADGVTYQSTGAIDFIVIQTGRGVDIVDYTMTGVLVGSRTVIADLGARADTFTAHVSGATVGPDSRFIIQAFGDGGGDHLTVDADTVNVGANALFEVDLVGGKAKDTLTANYVPGIIDPTANVTINLQDR
jgi:hypothetical protein